MTDAVLDTLRDALAGQYAFERELGRGGMGVVYLARDLQLDRPVAIKVLPPALADDDALARFVREARTAAQLAHPNVVPVHRADRAGGVAYFVMGYVEGESLADRIRARGPLPVADVVRWLREVAWALAYAHARGVVHRDVKPENILLERSSGRAMVTDFGIARRTEADAFTKTGIVLGTAYYMSPEQVSGEPLDGRSDLYSLGVVGYHALAGRLPFEGNAIGAILVAHATRPAPSLLSLAPRVPAPVAGVIDRCLAKAPEDRYATGEALADALQRALERAEAAPSAIAAPDAPPVILTETQAAAIFERAARLQAEALQRLDTRSAPGALRAAGSAPFGAAGGAGATTPDAGYKLAHVQQAAAEAGISEQYVALALAEVKPAASGLVTMPPSGAWQEKRAESFLGTNEKSISLQRVIRASPRRVLQTLGAVLQRHPFGLQLLRSVGGHPLDGGVLVFRLPGSTGIVSGSPAGVVYQWSRIRHQLEAEDVQVMLRPIPGDPDACQVTMFVDLRPGVRRNVNASLGVGTVIGTLTGIGGITFGSTALTLSALGMLGFGTAIAVTAGAAMMLAYRPLYRSVVRKANAELGRAMDAVEAGLQSEALFGNVLELARIPPSPSTAPYDHPTTTPRP